MEKEGEGGRRREKEEEEGRRRRKKKGPPNPPGIVYFSDTRTGVATHQIHAHTEEVSALKLTEDGRLITAGKDQCLKIFDKHGQEIFQIDLGETLKYVLLPPFSPLPPSPLPSLSFIPSFFSPSSLSPLSLLSPPPSSPLLEIPISHSPPSSLFSLLYFLTVLLPLPLPAVWP
jgi:WD40 repeat protein